MLDDLMFTEEELKEAEALDKPIPTFTETKSYDQDKPKKPWNTTTTTWTPKPEVIEEPYRPVTIYINREFPEEIKNKLFSIASKLIAAGYTVRYNADELDTFKKLNGISSANTEAYVPWKGFNEIDSKHSWNTKTSKHLAQTNFQAWEKLPGVIQSMLARDVRTLFGDKNTSTTMALITWSQDAATKRIEITKDTGRASFILKLAATYSFPIINIQKPGSEEVIAKYFQLGE